MNKMNKQDLLKVADLLGLVYVPAMVDIAIAAKVSEACTELARLQQALQGLAEQQED